MEKVSIWKGFGYLTSVASVLLLGAVSWKSASEDRVMALCLLLGMATSILGMAERWISHRMEQRKKEERRTAPPTREHRRAA